MAENTGIVSFFNDIIQQNLVSHFDKPDQSLTFVAGRVKQDTPNISVIYKDKLLLAQLLVKLLI